MQKSNSGRRFEVIVAFLIFLAAFFLFSYNYADPDLWGHIKFGEETYKTRSLIRYDPYSYIPGRKPWINHEWLSEVIFYLIYKLWGAPGLVLFKITIGLVITFVLLKIILAKTKFGWEVSPALLLLSLSATSFGFAIRPQIFTYLFFTIFIYILYSHQQGKKNLLFLLPILMVIWTNLHGGFLAGIGLISIYLLAELVSKLLIARRASPLPTEDTKVKTLLIVFFLTILSTLINPYFTNIWSFLFKTIPRARPYIWEWSPATLDLLLIDTGIHYLILVGVSLFLTIFSKLKISLSEPRPCKQGWGEFCLLLATLALSLKHIRHIPLFGITAAFVLPSYLEHLILTKKRESINLLKKLTIIFLCIVNVSLIYEGVSKKGKDFFKIRLKENYYPVRVVQFIQRNNLPGNLLADFDWSQYCIWKLYPQCKIFIDGRYKTVYPSKIIDEYFDFVYAKNGWEKFLEKYPHHWIFIRKTRPVARFLPGIKGWIVAYNLKDSPAILLIKKDSPSYRQILTKLKDKKLIYPPPRINNFFP
jgi:hypothetical protein